MFVACIILTDLEHVMYDFEHNEWSSRSLYTAFYNLIRGTNVMVM